MSPGPYLLGIDGGGSHTTAWLADGHGRVLARSVAGPSNPLKVGFEAAQRELLCVASLALRGAGLKTKYLDAVCAGLAGTDQPSVHRRILAWLRRWIPARWHRLTTDAEITLEAALGSETGIVVISGTGSIGYGRDERGRVRRAGGWGAAFDDAGSGFDLGRKAIAASLRDWDGRGPSTTLRAKICRALRLRQITDLVPKTLAPHEVAALFPIVMYAADEHDAVARALCEEAASDLGNLAGALLKQLQPSSRPSRPRKGIPVVCAGGVFQSGRIRHSFARHVRRHAPSARVSRLRRQPVEGALALARELLAAKPGDAQA